MFSRKAVGNPIESTSKRIQNHIRTYIFSQLTRFLSLSTDWLAFTYKKAHRSIEIQELNITNPSPRKNASKLSLLKMI